MSVLLIQTHETVGPDMIGDALRRQEVPHETLLASDDARYPALDDFDSMMIFGSPASCRELDQHPHLLQVRDFAIEAIRATKPTLGICFGGQLIAHMLTAEVRLCNLPEFGCYDITLTDAGRRSPFFTDFPPVFPSVQFHRDTFDLPRGAELLAKSDRIPHQAFVYGSCLALQFHIETSVDTLERWANAHPEGPADAGKTPDVVIQEARATQAQRAELCDRFVANFLRAYP